MPQTWRKREVQRGPLRYQFKCSGSSRITISFLSDGMCDVMSSRLRMEPKPVAYLEGYQPSFKVEASASGAFFWIQSRTNNSWSLLFAKTRPLNNVF